MDKQGSTLGGWIIGFGFVTLFLFMLMFVYNDLNVSNGVNYDSSFGTGINVEANKTYSSLVNFQEKLQVATQNGSASFSNLGFITLTTSWQVLQTSLGLVSTVISGQWILNAVALMNLPSMLGLLFQVIYLLTLGYIILKIIFRMNT